MSQYVPQFSPSLPKFNFRPPQLKLFWGLAISFYVLALVAGVISIAQLIAYPAPVSTDALFDVDPRYIAAMTWATLTGMASSISIGIGVFFTIAALFVGAATNIAEKHAATLLTGVPHNTMSPQYR